MKRLFVYLTTIATLFSLAGTECEGSVLAGWNQFNASTAGFPRLADTVGGNVGTTSLSIANLSVVNSSEFALGGTPPAGRWNQSSLVDLTQYIEFRVEAASGYELSFDSFQLSARHDDDALNLYLRSSIDSFSSNIGSKIMLSGAATDYSVDLSGLAAQSGQVRFRLYGVDAVEENVFFYGSDSGNVGGGGFVAINGDANLSPVPEPATIAMWSLLGCCGLVGYGWRRRRASSQRT